MEEGKARLEIVCTNCPASQHPGISQHDFSNGFCRSEPKSPLARKAASKVSVTLLVLPGEVQLVLVNHCNYGVWPGVLGSVGHNSPEGGGFHLGIGQEAVLAVPSGWSGRIWGRQGCCFDEKGKGSCDSGDCGGLLRCNGTGGTPPATVVEMTLGTHRSPLHYYDVSLVEGFNLPVTIAPVGGGKGCGGVAGCLVDLNACCPSRFEVKQKGKVVGCKSACLALKTDKYCCTGEYGSPERCKPTLFSHLFKSICPRAYSFAYDSSSTLNMCRASRPGFGSSGRPPWTQRITAPSVLPPRLLCGQSNKIKKKTKQGLVLALRRGTSMHAPSVPKTPVQGNSGELVRHVV
ncbi:hypothetical protein MUK42_05852 [Musa troglodytarum]|uniref:Thaumatin-like protein n=1 Tax=Musa troglodytarum TaxID=320322 RepID=A0A9E7KS98_9LILI|nr:hypothetical protein MUK42_05852 [Musa troglodytarum]